VLTTFGVAVVIKLCQNDDDCRFYARLWRIPGKSIASSSYACLRKDSILKSLPAAPGMTTTLCSSNCTDEVKVLLWCYSSTNDVFLATKVATDESIFLTLRPEEIQPAKSAKFYPLMLDLMQRGDSAASTATALIANTPGLQVLMKTTPSVLDIETVVEGASETVGEISEKVASMALQSVVLPDASQIQQVVTMLKDDELTTLLERGRERLRQLMTDDIPQATEKACADLGITFAPYSSSGSSLVITREKALAAINDLLAEHAGAEINVENLKEQMETQFSAMFDTLSEAARSDARLSSIFETISEKTSEWQEATGRVLATRSASLFFEGTQRFQARAATIFSSEQLSWARESSLKLTKEFTEGDAALARLKSIELGDAVRKKLFAAIELRSGSKGGLDGIIADALTSIDASTHAAGEVVTKSSVQMMLANLQKSASSATQNAHETLLATLARKSQFRDLALLKIEETMVTMAGYFGDDDISAEELAMIASGEGGTAAIFDPIARKAAKEIEKQLDLAEKNFGSNDPMALSVLSNVRKIISGDLSIAALTDEVVKILNDETSVAAGEQIVLQGERFLDVIESASKNKYLGDVMQVVEKAGLTKEGVVKQLEILDMNQIVNAAESAITNENTRKEILSSAADSALDFILRVLPSMPVPPFDGVKDGLIYHLSNLSMEGFKVRKEDILVEILGQNITANDEDLELRSKLDNVSEAIDDAVPDIQDSLTEKSSGLLVIDVRNISAVLEDAVWSFEQTYFPYFKGDGKAFVQLWEGSIRLQFDLRKRRVTGSEENKWEPVLCLHEHLVCIREIELRLIGEGRIVWMLNKIASMLKGPLSTFVVKSVRSTLGNSSGLLLERLNDTLGSYWPFLLNMAGLQLDDLPEITAKDVIKAEVQPKVNEVELVWREKVPLGINLLMGDGSGLIKVVDFPRGSQARSVVDKIQLNADAFKGSTITAVNGNRYDADSQEELIDALRDPGRPKAVTFLLTNSEEAERIRLFCSKLDDPDSLRVPELPSTSSYEDNELAGSVQIMTLTDEGPIGIQFSNSPDDFCLVVEGFSKDENGKTLLVERDRHISIGDILVSVNGNIVLGDHGSGRARALSLFENVGSLRPLKLGFVRPYIKPVVLACMSNDEDDDNSGPKYELLLGVEKSENNGTKKILVTGFEGVAGAIERSDVFIGDSLIYLNGEPIGAASRQLGIPSKSLEDVVANLQNDDCYPMSLMFARAKTSNRWFSGSSLDITNATKFNVTVNRKDELGCEFEGGNQYGDAVVKNFVTVEGPIQRILLANKDRRRWLGMSIESIDGQVIPSYANCDMVLNVMQQSWKKHKRLEFVLCDDAHKRWLQQLVA